MLYHFSGNNGSWLPVKYSELAANLLERFKGCESVGYESHTCRRVGFLQSDSMVVVRIIIYNTIIIGSFKNKCRNNWINSRGM